MPPPNPIDRSSGAVVVVGSAGLDTNIYLPGGEIDFTVEANFTENIDYLGQAGGYACRGYIRLGCATSFIGFLGDDFSGDTIRQQLAADGVDLSAVFTDPAGTARSVNIMYPDGRRKNFYDGKSHMTSQPDLEICRAVFRRAAQAQPALAHFNLPNWARQLLPIARQAGLVIACDLQDVIDPNDPYRQDFILQSDILFFSAVNHPNPTPLFECFWQKQPNLILVCGMGAQGAALGTGGNIHFSPPVDLPAPVIDTNGAGDSLAVALLASYLFHGYDLPHALLRGQIAARHACTLRADSSNLIYLATLDKLTVLLSSG
jgi:sugar/nucleoside kinase (ribokinase family)